jgi:hypothetical protein
MKSVFVSRFPDKILPAPSALGAASVVSQLRISDQAGGANALSAKAVRPGEGTA